MPRNAIRMRLVLPALGLAVGVLVARASGEDGGFVLALAGGAAMGLDYVTRRYVDRWESRQRVWSFIVLMIAYYIGYGGLAFMFAMAESARPATDSSQTTANPIVGIVLVWTAVMVGSQLERVGYRGRDTFMVLIPFYGIVFVGKILWRISALPTTPWREQSGVVAEVPVTPPLVTPASRRIDPLAPPEARVMQPASPAILPPPPPIPAHVAATVSPANAPMISTSGGSIGSAPSWGAGRRLAAAVTQSWWVLGIAIGLVALVSVSLTAVVLARRDAANRSTASASPSAVVPHVVAPPADPEPVAPPLLEVQGTLYVASHSISYQPSKTCAPGLDVFAADPARRKAEAARLSFSTDQAGQDVIGAVGMSGQATLVRAPIDGKPTCVWKMTFATQLPAETQAFFIHYGYTSRYWGPYSQYEADDLGIAMR